MDAVQIGIDFLANNVEIVEQKIGNHTVHSAAVIVKVHHCDGLEQLVTETRNGRIAANNIVIFLHIQLGCAEDAIDHSKSITVKFLVVVFLG